MMEQFITASRIANSILQDSDFSGYIVLVEGKKDIKIYRRFIKDKCAKLKPTFGKSQLREVYKILSERSFDRKIGIRDADFLRIKDNPKYLPDYSDDIFVTDCHDSEVMMLNSGVLRDYLVLISDEEAVSKFEKEFKIELLSLLYSLTYRLGCLRLANRRYVLGLAFKPKEQDGNRLKLEKFISDKKWTYLGDEQMINAVFEYSVNRGKVASRENINLCFQQVVSENHPVLEVVNGHDISGLLLIISRNALKSKK